MKRPVLCLVLSTSLSWAVDDLDRLKSDYMIGELSLDDLMIQQVARLVKTPYPEMKYLSPEPIKCGTHVLRFLGENHSLLSPSAVTTLTSMGVDFDRSVPGLFRPSGLDRHFDMGIFRFHFTMEGENGVDPADADADGIPDYVHTMASTFDEVAELELDLYGYTRPPSDNWYDDNGGNSLYDIYLKRLGENVYGYTQWEFPASNQSGDNEYSTVKEKNASTSYLVVRNNYDGFPYLELESIRVTAAHEFFHAIQLGYDGWESTWMLEATATWMEDEVYDDINDSFQYLEEWFGNPELALNYDSATHWYGSWIFFRYLSEHMGGHATIRKIFEKSIDNDSQRGDHSISTIDAVLRDLGESFNKAFTSMVIANEVLSSDPGVGEYSYEEADDYRLFGIRPEYRDSILLTESEHQFSHNSGILMHNASHYIKVTASEGPLEVKFSPGKDEPRYQVMGIVKRGLGSILVYDIGMSFIVDVPPNVEDLVIAVVTDTSDNLGYYYSLNL
ncbi:MAG: MXAN_6640 family putative metalloprotease, partial [Candidatus Neomarinimicrobiota bacterium]